MGNTHLIMPKLLADLPAKGCALRLSRHLALCPRFPVLRPARNDVRLTLLGVRPRRNQRRARRLRGAVLHTREEQHRVMAVRRHVRRRHGGVCIGELGQEIRIRRRPPLLVGQCLCAAHVFKLAV